MAENLPVRKMKPICLIAVLATLVNYVWAADDSRDLYSPRYDIINVDAILGSKRLVTNYADCLLNKKPCPPEGKDLKRILPEALRTKCAKCSVYQKENALKIITALYYQYPENYNRLAEKWDPTGEYNKRFEEYLANKDFNQIGSDDPPASSSVSNVAIQQSSSAAAATNRPVAGGVANRFGFDDADTGSVAVVTNRAPTTTSSRAPPTTRPTQRPQIPQFDPQTLPIVNYINNLGNKLTNTAGILAGMVRNTVRVIIGVEPLPQQRF